MTWEQFCSEADVYADVYKDHMKRFCPFSRTHYTFSTLPTVIKTHKFSLVSDNYKQTKEIFEHFTLPGEFLI